MPCFSFSGQFRIPVVALFCGVLFAVYGLVATGQHIITCDRLSPGQVQCQVVRSFGFGRFPPTTTQFWLQEVTIDSDLCDKTPRGGVRFCHRVTLWGRSLNSEPGNSTIAQPLPPMQTPLSTATVREKFLRFINGEGEEQLRFTKTGQRFAYIKTTVLGLLLAIVAWGFWDIQWPPVKISPLAMDGNERE